MADIRQAPPDGSFMADTLLGLSMLVDAINHRRSGGTTETTVLGPFFVHGAKEIRNGDDMAAGWKGEPTYVSGRVLSAEGTPLAGALLDLWQSNSESCYDVQLADTGGRQLRAAGMVKQQAARSARDAV